MNVRLETLAILGLVVMLLCYMGILGWALGIAITALHVAVVAAVVWAAKGAERRSQR